MSARIGVVTGLRAEARCITRRHRDGAFAPLLASVGGSARRAHAAAAAFIAEGVDGLVSFGIAGGLAPGLPVGALVLADAVMPPDGGQLPTSKGWRARLKARLGSFPVYEAPLAGSDVVVRRSEQKAALCAKTGALAVDMESHGIARAAHAAEIPYLVVRVISDPLEHDVPWSALAGMAADGRLRGWPVVGHLLLRPWELPGLLRLRANSRIALEALGRVAAIDPVTFGFI